MWTVCDSPKYVEKGIINVFFSEVYINKYDGVLRGKWNFDQAKTKDMSGCEENGAFCDVNWEPFHILS